MTIEVLSHQERIRNLILSWSHSCTHRLDQELPNFHLLESRRGTGDYVWGIPVPCLLCDNPHECWENKILFTCEWPVWVGRSIIKDNGIPYATHQGLEINWVPSLQTFFALPAKPTRIPLRHSFFWIRHFFKWCTLHPWENTPPSIVYFHRFCPQFKIIMRNMGAYIFQILYPNAKTSSPLLLLFENWWGRHVIFSFLFFH